ncbi:hypothetical protein H5U98_21350 [Mycolicibacterium boenickei]|uniref:Uncharacterized protein n=1 Tax=Mycolicibacterium boenickei TaxID=146017 RepID=A0AAX2ZSD0_9MYCO|nr:hypothetical protein [Mycolicibacterium boenickei]UNB98091.1 hypothetical protein H5U98_21350 [Mycolicibacterium boenickei]BBX93851.1 hypothetical protein MBOE_55000 [Mycolicibacterium boenickei]
MDNNIEFSGVAVAGMPSVLAVAAAAVSPAVHRYAAPAAPAAAAAWLAAAAISPQHKRRPAAATGASVDRSPY